MKQCRRPRAPETYPPQTKRQSYHTRPAAATGATPLTPPLTLQIEVPYRKTKCTHRYRKKTVEPSSSLIGSAPHGRQKVASRPPRRNSTSKNKTKHKEKENNVGNILTTMPRTIGRVVGRSNGRADGRVWQWAGLFLSFRVVFESISGISYRRLPDCLPRLDVVTK